MFRMILPAGQQADVVDAHVGNISYEEAVFDCCAAAVQKIDGGSRNLRAVVAEDAMSKDHGILCLSKVLNRNAGSARARVIPVDLDMFNRGIGPCINLDAA